MRNFDDEKGLIKACLKGDLNAQRSFYDRFASKMLGVCWRFAKSREEAEDLLQDGFFKVFCDLSTFQGKGSLEGWVRKVIVNVVLQHVRKRKLSFQSDFDIENMEIGDRSHEQILHQLEIEELLKSLHVLPKGCQVIFNLFVLEGYTHKEIAKELNITVGTSKSQLAKARMLIRSSIVQTQI